MKRGQHEEYSRGKKRQRVSHRRCSSYFFNNCVQTCRVGVGGETLKGPADLLYLPVPNRSEWMQWLSVFPWLDSDASVVFTRHVMRIPASLLGCECHMLVHADKDAHPTDDSRFRAFCPMHTSRSAKVYMIFVNKRLLWVSSYSRGCATYRFSDFPGVRGDPDHVDHVRSRVRFEDEKLPASYWATAEAAAFLDNQLAALSEQRQVDTEEGVGFSEYDPEQEEVEGYDPEKPGFSECDPEQEEAEEYDPEKLGLYESLGRALVAIGS